MQNPTIGSMPQRDVHAALAEYGASLATMLAASGMTDEEKQAWAQVVPEMSLEQLDRFQGILYKYIDVQAQDELKDVVDALRPILEDYEDKKKQADADFAQGIAEVKAEIQES